MRFRTEEPVEVPITSLIDIVFLLIIFFVVTSAMDQEELDRSVTLARAQYLQPVAARDPRTITINLKTRNEQETELNIAKVPLSLAALNSVLKKSVERYGNDVPVVIRADGDVRYRDLNVLLGAIRDAGLSTILFSAQDITKR